MEVLEINAADLTRFTDRFSLGRDRGLSSRQFLRIKVPSGILSSEHLRAFAQLSDKFGGGYVELTDRQDIQLHWIKGKDAPEIFSRLDQLGFSTDKCGQGFPGARYGDVRNVVVCPVSGLNKEELIDVSPIARRINDFFIGNPDYLDLPRKFKISITGCELACTRPEMQDLGLFAIKHEGRVGFAAIVGGSLGPSLPGPRLGKPLGVFIEPEDAFEVIRAMVDLFREHGNRENKMRARFKWLVEMWGLEKLRDEFELRLGRKLDRLEHGYPEVSGEEHVGIHEQKDGKSYICVPVIGGVLSSEKFRAIADIADEFAKGEIRITPYQNFILPHVGGDGLNAVLRRLSEIGLPAEGTVLRHLIVGCAADFCGKSMEPHPKQLAGRMVRHLESRFGDDIKDLRLLIHLSGCVNDCGLHQIGHIGLLGIKSIIGGEVKQTYNLCIGGGLGNDSSFSQVIERMLTPEQVIAAVENLVRKCLKEGFRDFGQFLRAHNLESLKRIASGGLR